MILMLYSPTVIPGYGHAVLRKPDPRFMALQQFGESRPEVAADPVFGYVNALYKTAPAVGFFPAASSSFCS
jgi:citrate synthase